MSKAAARKRSTLRGCEPFRKKSRACKHCCHSPSTPTWHITFSARATTKRWSCSTGRSSRIQLDDELFVHDRLNLFARWDARDLSAEGVPIDRKPVRDRNDLGEIKIT